jgi:membrane-associated phospholipid phosphatase
VFHWERIAIAYLSYLGMIAWVRQRHGRARWPALAAATVGWSLLAVSAAQGWPSSHPAVIVTSFLALTALLGGYWISGLFFVQPMTGVEDWLMRIDAAVLHRSRLLDRHYSGPRLVQHYFELAYLLVYLVVPAGAVVLAAGGHGHEIGYFWTVVLLSAYVSYGVLPWVQTRPPRALGREDDPPRTPLRRFNLAILSHSSIQVNTIPSGHAACAVATALAVGTVMPVAGAGFMVLAASITVATVLGRYHYVIDSILGVLVGVFAWALVTFLA